MNRHTRLHDQPKYGVEFHRFGLEFLNYVTCKTLQSLVVFNNFEFFLFLFFLLISCLNLYFLNFENIVSLEFIILVTTYKYWRY